MSDDVDPVTKLRAFVDRANAAGVPDSDDQPVSVATLRAACSRIAALEDDRRRHLEHEDGLVDEADRLRAERDQARRALAAVTSSDAERRALIREVFVRLVTQHEPTEDGAGLTRSYDPDSSWTLARAAVDAKPEDC